MSLLAQINNKADYEVNPRNWLYLFILFVISVMIVTTPSHANTEYTNYKVQQSNQQISKVKQLELKKLATHKQWQHLLFYKNGSAEVISPNFYLSDINSEQKRKFSPYQELIATLNQANNLPTICKYPARYYWLNHHLPELNIDLSNCQNLPNAQQSISIILVSSYLKNPASTFGHVLIKTNDNISKATLNTTNTKVIANTSINSNINTNTDKSISNNPSNPLQNQTVHSTRSEDLLNQSYNFGASIPNNENGAFYAVKGLFGFYDAGFSKADFFKQDAVYSKNEQRDMWEYVLNLDEFNTALLIYHLYEAQSARFTYYFLKQNCGYRSGEILELISDISTTDRVGGWYAPDYVFDQLVEYGDDSIGGDAIGSRNFLIKESIYLPSEQTQLLQKFAQLPSHLQQVINRFINTEDIQSLVELSEQEQALTIDFLLTHRNYKLSQVDNDEKKYHETVKKQLISKRFTLPVSDEFVKLPLKFKPSPALSNKTTQTALTLSDEKVNLGLTLFVKDPLSDYTDLNKRFKAVQLSAEYMLNSDNNDDVNDRINFDEFTFLDMQQIENYHQSLAGEPQMAWQMRTGIEPDPIHGLEHMTYIESGVGTGVELLNSDEFEALGYGFVNAHLHDQKNADNIGYIDASIQLGVRIKDKNNSRAGELEYSLRKRDGKTLVQQTKMTLRQGINKNNDLRMGLFYNDNDNLDSHTEFNKDDFGTELSYNYYW